MDDDISVREHEVLAAEWYEMFGESMPWGFVIGPSQVPMLRQCIATRSQEPLQAYIESLDPDCDY